jgi:hypothetical protein
LVAVPEISMLSGVACGIATCALRGLTFVVSRAIVPFTTLDLTVTRYGLFAPTSIGLIIHPRFRPRGITFNFRDRSVSSRRLAGVGMTIGIFSRIKQHRHA